MKKLFVLAMTLCFIIIHSTLHAQTAGQPPKIKVTLNNSGDYTPGETAVITVTVTAEKGYFLSAEGCVTSSDFIQNPQNEDLYTAIITVTSPGTYTGTITVFDKNGKSTVSFTIVVRAPEPPIVP